MAVTGIDVDASREQALGNPGEAARNRIDDRRFAGAIGGVGIGALFQQQSDHTLAAVEGRRGDKVRPPTAPAKLTLAPRSISSATALGRLASMARKKRGCPRQIAQFNVGAVLQQQSCHVGLGGLDGMMQGRVAFPAACPHGRPRR